VKIAAMIAICNFPYWRRTIDALESVADDIVVRYDDNAGDPEILRELNKMADSKQHKIRHIQIVKESWRCPQWREDCLALICKLDVKPDIILCPDEDEIFESTLKDELAQFWLSEKKGMMFSYAPLVSDNGRVINEGMPYPPDPHMKAFKYEDGISYWPYHGNAIIAKYQNPVCHWKATTKIRHYCCFTQAMEQTKHFRSDTPKGRGIKAVTIVGFGPSAQKLDESKVRGEVWSMNDCYQGFSTPLMKNVTRVFDIHMIHKRVNLPAKDGKQHLWHLDQLGRLGHRIILQQPHAQVTNSEAYPLYQILGYFGLRYFTGTGAYMLANAIYEGYNHISVFGLDQRDWEHLKQRDCFAFWCGIAMGRGIEMGGELTFLNMVNRIYGYEWGPEFDEQAQKDLWDGFPFDIRMKEKTQASAGELHGNWEK